MVSKRIIADARPEESPKIKKVTTLSEGVT
jgi:hypothetical protein